MSPRSHADVRCTRSPDELYEALCRRAREDRGAFFVGVTTTGVFCTPGCPARTPLRKHCEFFPSSSSALQAGYRPCKRCRPLDGQRPVSDQPPWAGAIIDRLCTSPERLLSAGELRALGVSPEHATRYFQARLGASVQSLSRAARVGLAMRVLRAGRSARAALDESGFASENGLRKAVSELFGIPLSRAGSTPGPRALTAAWLDTPLGPMVGIVHDRGVCFLEFVDRRGLARQLDTLRSRHRAVIAPGTHPQLAAVKTWLDQYFNKASDARGLTIIAPGTPMQEHVWRELREISLGSAISYAELARRVGKASAVRAVATAVGANRIALAIPCHRVIGSSGDLTGYAGGLWRKAWLLEHEAKGLGVSDGAHARTRTRMR
jgi:AraC family transcriptional regulator, regulatory protein of adaptative response / methylated-DNA-[protein]-cysteine methyltransferase